MIEHWQWIALGALVIAVVCQEIRVRRIHSESKKCEELFQIVTENAADMIALVDVKGNRLYNSPRTSESSGTPRRNWERRRRLTRSTPTIDSRF